MNYTQSIDFLYTHLPMFSRDGATAIKNDLSNTVALCKAIGDPQKQFKSIHIAGTNGKGSSSHMLAAVLQSAGYKVGLYTSPHLYDFRERIRIDGHLCSEEFVVKFVATIQPLLERIKPSFFEITVAMAFACFADQAVDIAVIETGLGGRLDSTNIIDPELSLITNIGFDHMQFLGDTIPLIAAEKAGIIKKTRPVVISEYLPESRPVFTEFAQNLNAPISFAQDEWTVQLAPRSGEVAMRESLNRYLTIQASRKHTDGDEGQEHTYQLVLKGLYQLRNLAGVLETIYQLRLLNWQIELRHVQAGLKDISGLTGLMGRWEEVLDRPRIIADVGHNVDGIKMIREQLDQMDYNKLHIITGFVKDKDIRAALSEMPKKATYYFTKAPIARAMDEKDLQLLAGDVGLKGKSFDHLEAALTAAGSNYLPDDLILVCGSVFLVAELKGALLKAPFTKK